VATTLLVLYNPHNEDHAHWTFVNETGQASSLGYGSIDNLTSIATGHRVTLLLDSSCLNIHQVKIPTQNRQRQLQAIPYALEDVLADDIEDLHFAAGKRQPDESIPVITIQCTLLETIIQRFKDAGILLEAISADGIALPIDHDQWTLLIDNERALIKTANFKAYYCDLDLLDIFLPTLYKKSEPKPGKMIIYHSDQQQFNLDSVNSLELETTYITYRESPLEFLAQSLPLIKQLNILQGPYTIKRETSVQLKPWKSVAAVFFAWLCIQLVYAGVEINQLETKNTELNSLIQKEFKSVHPGNKNYSRMRKDMIQTLSDIRGNGNSDEKQLFLSLLAEATPALSNNSKLTINGIIFRNKFVDFDIQADSLQTLEAVKSRLLNIASIKIVMSTTVEKDKVKGRLRLEQKS